MIYMVTYTKEVNIDVTERRCNNVKVKRFL